MFDPCPGLSRLCPCPGLSLSLSLSLSLLSLPLSCSSLPLSLSLPVSAPVLVSPVSVPVLVSPISAPVLVSPVSVPVLVSPVSVPVLVSPISAPVLVSPISVPVLVSPCPCPCPCLSCLCPCPVLPCPCPGLSPSLPLSWSLPSLPLSWSLPSLSLSWSLPSLPLSWSLPSLPPSWSLPSLPPSWSLPSLPPSWSLPSLSLSWSLPRLCPCPGSSSSLSLSWSLLVSTPGLCLSLASGSRLSGRLGRSESLRVSDRRRPSRGSLGAKGRGGGRSRSDVDMDPSSATAVLGPARRATPEPGDDGEPGRSGLELEPEEPPGWRELIPPDTLHRLPKSQVKRQEVISEMGFRPVGQAGLKLLGSSESPTSASQSPGIIELLVTEAAHVRMLRVLHDLFYQPMAEGGFFPLEELQNIFPSLDELIEVHSLFLDRLMKRRQESGYLIEEIGDVLLARFDGAEGSWFQKISSRFCSRQSFALEQLKAKQRKEPRFCAFVQEAESRPRCRRLQLKDMIPTEMQRLTKYPLLLQSIGQNTEESTEREKVELAAECCREILHHVNQAVRDMEDLLRLKDYQRRLDLSHLRQSSDPMLSEFKNLDITKKKLVHEGSLTWRVTKDKAVEVHVLLLDDLLLLLQRQDERLLLKSHSRTLTPTPDGKTMLRPVLRLTSAMTREVATDHKAFYVIFTWDQEAQIYELVAQTVSERKNWCALITETAGSLKVPAPASRPKPRPSPSSSLSPCPCSPPGPGVWGHPALPPLSTREPLLSSSENGNGGRETSQADARTERILSDLLPFCRPGPEGQLAATALRKVLSLKQLLFPVEEDSGAGPPPDGHGVPGGGPLSPARTQEIQENLLSLEETMKQLEELEEEFCRLRPLLSQLGGNSVTQPGCT
ncbi:rho guanine nucleotide exchange factor 1 isoform X6 [Aotus nancymaae]|uniref:rho guanine nucleotide exchange factor 1 isoform X6 n=1 Tax=Aotus nancymaae TaxID=37293 RepID=UPI0030FF3675